MISQAHRLWTSNSDDMQVFDLGQILGVDTEQVGIIGVEEQYEKHPHFLKHRGGL